MILFTGLCFLLTVHVATSFHAIALRSKLSSSSTLLYQSTQSIPEDKCGKCPMAPKCSGEFLEKGCDGTGKIQGGIATVPFFQWWPIKVFRPCPSYLQAGYQYRREGQTMDQVLFSEPSTKMKERMKEIEQSRLTDMSKNEKDIDTKDRAKDSRDSNAANDAVGKDDAEGAASDDVERMFYERFKEEQK